MQSIAPIFLRADAHDTVILVSQSLADYLGVEKSSLLNATLESVAGLATGELRDCFRRAESGRRLDQLVVDGFSRVFEAKTWSEGGVFDVVLDEVTSLQPVLDALRDFSSIPTDDLSEEEMATIRRPDRRTVSILSARLVNFSEFIGRMTPIEARLVVGSFMDEATAAIPEFGGVPFARAEEFCGGIFGAPRSFADHALRALNAGLQLTGAMEKLRKASSEAGREFPMVACGIATGECMVGTFGTPGTSRYSALGAGADIAQQLANLARPGEVLITESCLREILARLPEGWTTEEFSVDEAPDLSRLRWSGDEVQPLSEDKQMRAFALRSTDSGSGPPEVAFHYIWSLQSAGSMEAIPVLRAEIPSASGAQLAVSDEREESSFLQVFGKYRLVKLVGSGGMGKVWKARDRFGNTVALKSLHESGNLKPEQIRRFQREAEVMSRLPHRNICRIYEAGEFERIQYITMEFVDGLSLAELLSGPAAASNNRKTGISDLQTIIRKVRSDIASAKSREDSGQSEPKEAPMPASRQRLLLPTEQAITLFVKVCEAVQFAHEHGVLHRDLKPGNILLREDGEPLVADFGLAKFTGENDGHSISVSGHVLGTLANMAPEQAESSKNVDERADIYSLGTILYVLMTGKAHFQPSGNFFADVQKLKEHTAPSARSVNLRVDADMDIIIAKCLRPNPGDRYRSVSSLLNDLNLYRRGEAVSARRISPVEHGVRWTKRHRIAAAAALAALLLVIGGSALGFWALSQRARESELSRAQLEKTLAERDEATRRSELVTAERHKAEDRVAAAEAETANERALREKAETALKNETDSRKAADAQMEQKDLRRLAEGGILELELPKSEFNSDPTAPAAPRSPAFDQGMKFLNGDGVEKSPEKAYALILQAANDGLLSAQTKVAEMQLNGTGTTKDEKSGIAWLQKAVAAGDADAQQKLGDRYREGRGVAIDKQKAFDLYMKSAAQGNPWGQLWVGLCYVNGDGVQQSRTEAMKQFELASLQNQNKGAKAHALRWRAKLSYGSDPQQAFQCHLQAAELGTVAYCQREVGIEYLQGVHVEKNASEARKWLTRAAEKGDVRAMVALAKLLSEGDTGVPKNPDESTAWYTKAADQGDTVAKAALAALKKQQPENSTPQTAPNSENNLIEIQGGVLPATAVGAGQKVSDFQISISEVTWADWKAVRDASIALGYDLAGVGQGKGGDYPVTGVSWLDAVKWCNAKSQMDGLAPAYTTQGNTLKSGNSFPDLAPEANGYRLPTVPEWEWAARGGTQSASYKFSGSNNPEAVMWAKENAAGSSRPVRTKTPNELGIFDMSGNVRELCWDQQKSPFKPLLGGCWVHLSQDGELSAKPLSEPIRRVINVGFRLARNSAQASKKADETRLEEAKNHIQSTRMDAKNQMLNIDHSEMEWSVSTKNTGWLYFTARGNQPVWTFSPCSKTDLNKIEPADLQGDFVQKGENEKIQSLFDPEKTRTAKGWNGGAIPVRENQVIIARRVDSPKKVYAIRLVDQVCELVSPKTAQIGADYLVITLETSAADYRKTAPSDVGETAAKEKNPAEAGESPAADTPAVAPKNATKESPFENSLGMKFVPVPGTDVLFSVWDTRVKDFRAYADASGYRQKGGVYVWNITKKWDLDAGASWESPGFEQTANHPVAGVSWVEAKDFCKWLTATERGKGKIGKDQEYRLPKDVEWSVAVGSEKYPWGNQWPPPVGAGNYDPSLKVDTYEKTSPVGQLLPNRFGLHDMGGNVWQWCEDWYRASMNESAVLEKQPFLQEDGDGQKYRVVRGGSWHNNVPEDLCSSGRYRDGPERRYNYNGFRCVLGSSNANADISNTSSAESEKNTEDQTRLAKEAAKEKNPAEAIASPGEPPDADTALLETQAAKGDVSAQYQLGNRYRDGKGVAKDKGKAAEWYRKAAMKGSTEADVELGNLYCGGFVKARPEDWARVAAVWEIQAKKGDVAAQNKLGGMCYRNGYGVRQDGAKAVYWLEKAAAQNDGTPEWNVGAAMWVLARMYSGDRDLPRDDRKAFYWAEKSAQNGGDARGMDKLAELYAEGRGAPKDPVKAEEWTRKAAAKRNPVALKLLEQN